MKKGIADLVDEKAGSSAPDLYPVEKIMVDMIDPSPANKRHLTDNDPKVKELADSIEAQGLLQAIIVRKTSGEIGFRYEIVAGERRWRAFRLKKWPLIPATVRDLSDKDAHDITAAENLQREDLTPIEEAESIQILLADGRDPKEVADRIGKPVSWVIRRARIADLSPKWLKAIADPKSEFSKWSATHLELIARYDHDMQEKLFEEYDRSYGNLAMITVKDLEKNLGERMFSLSGAPWKPADETLLPAIGACTVCQKRTGCVPSLFEPIEDTKAAKGDRCLDRDCWGKKLLAFHEINIKKEREEHKNLILIRKSDRQSILPDGNALEKSIESNMYKYNSAKKGDKKAIPAYVVEGPGAGKITYLKLQSHYSSSQAARPIGANGEPAPKPMKERREALDKRRVIRFINKLMMLLRGEDPGQGKPGTCRVCGCTETTPCIDKKSGDSCSWVEPDLCSACADKAEKKPAKKTKKEKPVDPRLAIAENLSNIEVFALVAAFGAAPNMDNETELFQDWVMFNKVAKMNGSDAQRIALYGAFDRIHEDLRQQTFGTPDIDFPDQLCSALKLNRDAIWNAVLAEIPEPKSWANPKSDGTPKK
jgi:ParB/RepB/Spo0J family partition protein